MSWDLDGVDVDAALQNLLDATLPKSRKPGDVTVAEYRLAAKRLRGVDMTYRQASYRLDREVAEGRMEKLTVWDDAQGTTAQVYRRVEGDTDLGS